VSKMEETVPYQQILDFVEISCLKHKNRVVSKSFEELLLHVKSLKHDEHVLSLQQFLRTCSLIYLRHPRTSI
jgi:hypothetical protein